jgi:hypothetical protein
LADKFWLDLFFHMLVLFLCVVAVIDMGKKNILALITRTFRFKKKSYNWIYLTFKPNIAL